MSVFCVLIQFFNKTGKLTEQNTRGRQENVSPHCTAPLLLSAGRLCHSTFGLKGPSEWSSKSFHQMLANTLKTKIEQCEVSTREKKISIWIENVCLSCPPSSQRCVDRSMLLIWTFLLSCTTICKMRVTYPLWTEALHLLLQRSVHSQETRWGCGSGETNCTCLSYNNPGL